MQQIKIEKRIAEELNGLRKLASFLPSGKANALLNKCNRIGKYASKAQAMVDASKAQAMVDASKAQAMVDAPVGNLFAQHANYDARTREDIAAQAQYKKAVFLALCSGRKVSLKDAAEFHLSQMHTAIAQIRRDIAKSHPDMTLCDEWVRPEGSRPFKRYWIVKKNN